MIFALVIGRDSSACMASDNQDTVEKEGKVVTAPTIPQQHKAYLGLMIEDLHPAIASHLAGIGSTGQGVLVQVVGVDTPAAKSGIREHDVLLTYDDQKLFNHGQLLKLVAGDQPGREVALGIIHEGKRETVKVRLGERPTGWIAPRLSEELIPKRPFRMGWRGGPQGRMPSDNIRASWNRIDSISIKRLEKDRFHALLTHFDKNGQLEKHEYEGTREELRKLIDADDDLKPNERYHLLRSLDIADHPNPWTLFQDEDSSSF